MTILLPILLALHTLPVSAQEGPKRDKPERPFWKSSVMQDESVLFVKTEDTRPVTRDLLLLPTRIRTVRNSSGTITYETGKDYLFTPGSRTLTLPPGSRIPVATAAQLTPPLGTQPFNLRRRDGKGDILFAAGHEYADMQVLVTYEYKRGTWKLPAPRFAEHELPRVLGKLKRGEPVSILFFGDSITVGGNASGFNKVAPFQPAYDGLVIQNLKRAYRSEITTKNFSVGGMTAAYGRQNIDKVAAEKPDLVVLAWGMNDSSGGAGRPTADFIADLQAQMDAVRKRQPQAEFVLVSSMLPNADCHWANPQVLLAYRDALKPLAAPGVAIADVTSLWAEILKTKPYLDFTGNGVNHPNDFGHHLYAQILSALLIK